jgi:ABC-type dipeptide transport system, periplasmic component
VDIDHGRLGRLRQGQGEIANHVIDEYAAGRLSRRDFLRRGAVVGISLPVLGAVISACGSSSSSTPSTSSSSGAAGATIKAGIVVPTATINPVTVADQGGLDMLGQTGEYLTFSNQHLTLQPALATSWTPNSDRGRVDVQDPPGREVPQRPAADRRRRRLHLQAANRPEGLGPTRCRRSAAG